MEERASLPLAGITIVITGTLAGLQRDAAEDALRELGAKVSGSVSKKTSFLVVGADAGSKLAKAQSLGVRILDEAALEQMLKTKQPPAGLIRRAAAYSEDSRLVCRSGAAQAPDGSRCRRRQFIVVSGGSTFAVFSISSE